MLNTNTVLFWFLFFSTREILSEIPIECGTALALMEQLSKHGLVSRTFLNSQLNEGAWSLLKMSINSP